MRRSYTHSLLKRECEYETLRKSHGRELFNHYYYRILDIEPIYAMG